MKNEYLYPNTSNIFENQECTFRVNQINDDGTNVKEVFEANLVNYIYQYKRFSDNREYDVFIDSAWIYDQYTKGQLQVEDDEFNGEESPCTEFVRFELNNFLFESDPKCKIYFAFLETHENTFRVIDRLINHYYSNSKAKDSFEDFASNKLQMGVINFKVLETAFNNLERRIIKTTILDLIHFLQFQEKMGYEKEISQVFDMEYFLNPALIQDPVELKNYREILKAWVNKIGQDLKYNLNLPSVPPIVLWMAAEMDGKNQPAVIEMETKDYPKYIFAHYNAYHLFDTLAKEMTSHPQISFLFRQMSEKEKPALIVTENSNFIKWFNQQEYSLTLDYPTKTYDLSKTDDRIILYNAVKSLINSR